MNLQARPGYRATQGLAVACVLFGLVILFEWTGYRKEAGEMEKRLGAAGEEAGLVLESRAQANFALRPIDDYAEMVERPLFVEGRKPPVLTAEENPLPAAGNILEPLKAQLMGVVATPEGMTILFVDSKGEYRRARQGGDLEGWRIREVKTDRIVLERGNGVEELLLRKPKPKTPVKAAARPRRALERMRGESKEKEEKLPINEENKENKENNE